MQYNIPVKNKLFRTKIKTIVLQGIFMARDGKLYKEEYFINHTPGVRDPRGIHFYSYFDSEFFPGFHSQSKGSTDLCVFALIVEGNYQHRSGKDGKFTTEEKGVLSLGGVSGRGGEIKVTGKNSCRRKCFLIYRTELFQQILLHYFPEGRGKFIRLSDPGKVESCFDRIKNEFISSGNMPDEARLSGLFLELMENAAKESGGKNEFPEVLSKALAFIEAHLSQAALTRQEIGEALGLTVRTLNRLFASHLKKGVTEYILERRLQMACGLLAFPFYRIGEVAEKCGFGSPIYMTRVFRKHFSCTPREYRKEHGKLPM